MKKSISSSRKNYGFTLVELLVVIAIMSILAAMLLTGISRARIIGQKTRASMEISQIVSAINKYDADYNHFPIARAAMNSPTAINDDFTYGGTLQRPPGWFYDVQASGAYKTNNSEIMSVLLDLDSFPNGPGHLMNPQKTRFLNAKLVSDANAPGVGPDGVYRDPWGNPYIITIDANNDGKARDAFYQLSTVSGGGINGLVKTLLPNNTTVYEVTSPVMVWSAGPDRMVDANALANQGANKDNVLSWK
jgi:prepilin-type N-terminal cleavage/methylation domain-containing protein